MAAFLNFEGTCTYNPKNAKTIGGELKLNDIVRYKILYFRHEVHI